MKISETFHAGGKPRGQIVRDDFSGEFVFLPREHEKRPPPKSWRSVDDLKADLMRLYGGGTDAGG